MTKFAFVVHPIAAKDAARRYPILKWVPDRGIEWLMQHIRPSKICKISGIRSITGAETEGWFIGLPMTPHMLSGGCPVELAYERIGECCKIASDLGADIIGLGAFSSVVGDGGITIAERSPIAVTTGNSYTVATAIEAALDACSKVGVDTSRSQLGVVGATGSIGRTCAEILAPIFESTVLVGRDLARTQKIAEELPRAHASINPSELVPCDVVVTVSSAGGAIVMPEHLAKGAIVIDVARPRDVSVRVMTERPDVLPIEGGVVRVPGEVEFNFNFGFPPKTAYACMSETIMLALENRPESFSLGKDISVSQVRETQRLAKKHGFELAGYRSFERAVSDEVIERTRIARTQRELAPA